MVGLENHIAITFNTTATTVYMDIADMTYKKLASGSTVTDPTDEHVHVLTYRQGEISSIYEVHHIVPKNKTQIIFDESIIAGYETVYVPKFKIKIGNRTTDTITPASGKYTKFDVAQGEKLYFDLLHYLNGLGGFFVLAADQ